MKTFRYKRLNEQRLRESGLDYTLVRASLFMDEWLALIGSSVPMRGAEAHTLRRPFWFSRMFMGLVGSLVQLPLHLGDLALQRRSLPLRVVDRRLEPLGVLHGEVDLVDLPVQGVDLLPHRGGVELYGYVEGI